MYLKYIAQLANNGDISQQYLSNLVNCSIWYTHRIPSDIRRRVPILIKIYHIDLYVHRFADKRFSECPIRANDMR